MEEIRDMGEVGLGRVGKAQIVGKRVGRGTEVKEKARRVGGSCVQKPRENIWWVYYSFRGAYRSACSSGSAISRC